MRWCWFFGGGAERRCCRVRGGDFGASGRILQRFVAQRSFRLACLVLQERIRNAQWRRLQLYTTAFLMDYSDEPIPEWLSLLPASIQSIFL